MGLGQQVATRGRWLQPNLRMMQLGAAIVIVQFTLFCFCRSSGLIVSNRFPSNTLWFHTPGRSVLKPKAKRSQHCRLDPCPQPSSVQQLLYFILIFLQNLTDQRLCKWHKNLCIVQEIYKSNTQMMWDEMFCTCTWLLHQILPRKWKSMWKLRSRMLTYVQICLQSQ